MNDGRRAINRQIACGCGGKAEPSRGPVLSERFGVSGVVVSSGDVHRGLGLLSGLEVVDPVA